MFTQEYMDTQDLLDQYWSDCYRDSEGNQKHEAVENLLKSFRKGLNGSSPTADAIDNGFPLDEISLYAEKDGSMEIAQLLSI